MGAIFHFAPLYTKDSKRLYKVRISRIQTQDSTRLFAKADVSVVDESGVMGMQMDGKSVVKVGDSIVDVVHMDASALDAGASSSGGAPDTESITEGDARITHSWFYYSCRCRF
jgi:hypothetical protein